MICRHSTPRKVERPQEVYNTLNEQAAGIILDNFGLQP